jgi:sec-independent protein translocase protein TatA
MSIGIWQVVLVLLIVLILFGAGKLPKVMGDVAKGVKNFKSGLKDEDEDQKEAIAADVTPRSGEAATVSQRDEAAKS